MSILSIQSHVAFGHVGNAAATFPLQRLGFDVWPVHTVMFSNHTGYEDFAGPVIDADAVRAVIDGMARRGVFSTCEAVLSGYLGSAAIGAVVRDAVRLVRATNPDMLYVCDPVIGDSGEGVYVADGIIEMLASDILPEADFALPNQFELEHLTGLANDSLAVRPLAVTVAAARGLFVKAPRLRAVIVTSVRHCDSESGDVEMIAVDRNAAWRVTTPRLAFVDPLSGAGDAVSALFAGLWLRRQGDSSAADGDKLRDVLGDVASAVHAVLE
ncbi:MAG: pyridoxal kinase, partial [Alphaproteobacteria bacterium]